MQSNDQKKRFCLYVNLIKDDYVGKVRPGTENIHPLFPVSNVKQIDLSPLGWDGFFVIFEEKK